MPIPLTLASDEGAIVAMIAITGGITVAVVTIIARTVRSVMETRHREESRREVAAYVAEGSISPQDAAMLLAAGNDEIKRRVADAVAWGTIKPQDAERLLNPDGRPR